MVFVSHANPEENEFARWLTLQLANEGYPVWCDQTKLLGSEKFWEDIEGAIKNRTAKFLYPKQHSANCTAKHQGSGLWFKPMVRILKNMRTRLVQTGAIEASTAPSYFIEGLLYNVPNDNFDKTYEDTFVSAFNWILNADQTKSL